MLLHHLPQPRLLNVIRHGGSVLKTHLIHIPYRENHDLTQRELADKLGVSVGRLNYCLNTLIEKVFVKTTSLSKSKDKFRYVYQLTPQVIAEKVALTNRFLKRKMEEYGALKMEIEALKAEVGEEQSRVKSTHYK